MDRDAAAWFLASLFGDAVDTENLVVVWSTPSKRACFAPTVDAALGAAEQVEGAGEDVYFGVGLYRPGVMHGRGKAADVRAIAAVWVDVDFGLEHKGKSRPPNEAAALAVTRRAGPVPSIVVRSGHGLHAYWLLSEPLTAEDGAATFARRWGLTVQRAAAAEGWAVDATHDLARVMRLPGTTNRKDKDRPVPVTILSPGWPADPARYDRWDLDAFLTVSDVGEGSGTITFIDIEPGRAPPRGEISERIDAMVEVDNRFRRTWQRKRADLKDESPSGYDLALANAAAMAGWADQEIADLIVRFRRKHGLDPKKAQRRDYLERTIQAAREGNQEQQAAAELRSRSDEQHPQAADKPDPEPAAKEGDLRLLSRALRVPVTGWIQQGREEAQYTLVLKGKLDVAMGRAADVTNQGTFRSRVWEAARIRPHRLKDRDWDGVLDALARIVEMVENPEAGLVNRLEGWLSSYLGDAAIHSDENWQEALPERQPFWQDGRLHVNTTDLRRHLRVYLDERVGRGELWPPLRAAGWTPVKLTGRAGKAQRVVGRSYWRAPEGWQAEPANGGEPGKPAAPL